MMTAIAIAMFATICFSGSSFLTLFGSEIILKSRLYAITIAAGILLGLALGDLFPESLELAGKGAIVGFIGGFALLFLIEMFTHAHTHHSPDEPVHKHALMPFVVGLALHNVADGFAIGTSASRPGAAAAAVGVGVLLHQLPVGISLAAVFAAAHATRGQFARAAVLLGLAIPAATSVTAALPVLGEQSLGILTGVAGGVLAYVSTAHLLPEAQAEQRHTLAGIIFTATLIIMMVVLLSPLGE